MRCLFIFFYILNKRGVSFLDTPLGSSLFHSEHKEMSLGGKFRSRTNIHTIDISAVHIQQSLPFSPQRPILWLHQERLHYLFLSICRWVGRMKYQAHYDKRETYHLADWLVQLASSSYFSLSFSSRALLIEKSTQRNCDERRPFFLGKRRYV